MKIISFVLVFIPWIVSGSTLRRYETDMLIHFSPGLQRTKSAGRELRVDYGQIGIDIFISYRLSKKWYPQLILSGHKVFVSSKDVKSARARFGGGIRYHLNEKWRITGQFLAMTSQLIRQSVGEYDEEDEFILWSRVIASMAIGKIKNGKLFGDFLIGVAIPGKIDSVKINEGQNIGGGLRYEWSRAETDELFLGELRVEAKHILAPGRNQREYSYIIRTGKRF